MTVTTNHYECDICLKKYKNSHSLHGHKYNFHGVRTTWQILQTGTCVHGVKNKGQVNHIQNIKFTNYVLVTVIMNLILKWVTKQGVVNDSSAKA